MECCVPLKDRCVLSYLVLMVLCMGLFLTKVSEGAAADLSTCPDALTKLLPCLAYTQGTSKVPSSDCCTHLETVHETKPQCLCALVAASVNGTKGVPKMNTTLSLELGPACKVATKPAVCPDLLGLSPDDPLNKIFTAGAPTSSTSTNSSSPGGRVPSAADTAEQNAYSPPNEASQHSVGLRVSFLLALAAFTLL